MLNKILFYSNTKWRSEQIKKSPLSMKLSLIVALIGLVTFELVSSKPSPPIFKMWHTPDDPTIRKHLLSVRSQIVAANKILAPATIGLIFEVYKLVSFGQGISM